MNRRQKKKKYKARHGYAKTEETKVQYLIRETITREMGQALYAALWKLKAYEETGLSPDEIVAMMELVGIGIPQPVADYIAKDFK